MYLKQFFLVKVIHNCEQTARKREHSAREWEQTAKFFRLSKNRPKKAWSNCEDKICVSFKINNLDGCEFVLNSEKRDQTAS